MERAKIPPAISLSIAGTAITILSLWYGQHHGWLPVAASQNAPLVDGLFNLMMTISVWLFLAIQGTIVLAVIKFRKKPGDETDGPPQEGNILLELVWTAIPVVIVIVLAVYSFDVYQQMGGLDPMASHDHTRMAQRSNAAIAAALDDADADADDRRMALGIGASPALEGTAADLTIGVTGMQYAWLFNYPGDLELGELHVPVNKDIQLDIEAVDVIHAFWVPQFRLKQDAIPGRTTTLRFRPERPGTYPIVCAELCGPLHGAMRSEIVVDTQEDYDEWYEEVRLSLLEDEDDWDDDDDWDDEDEWDDEDWDDEDDELASVPDRPTAQATTLAAALHLSAADRLTLHPNAPAIEPAAIAHLAHRPS